jgi:peptide deformylase
MLCRCRNAAQGAASARSPLCSPPLQRPTKVRVKAQDLTGKKFTLNLSGFPARIFQHEYDHLDGRLFHDRMQAEVLQGVKQQLVELEEEWLAAHPGAEVQRVA